MLLSTVKRPTGAKSNFYFIQQSHFRAVLTPKKQTIYDIIAGTLVVKKETPLQKVNLG